MACTGLACMHFCTSDFGRFGDPFRWVLKIRSFSGSLVYALLMSLNPTWKGFPERKTHTQACVGEAENRFHAGETSQAQVKNFLDDDDDEAVSTMASVKWSQKRNRSIRTLKIGVFLLSPFKPLNKKTPSLRNRK